MKNKIKQGLLWLTAFVLLVVFGGTEAKASAAGYEIKNFLIDANVREDAVIEIKEEISVQFHEPRHGIYRDIPLSLKVNREVDGKMKKFYYRVKVEEIKVKGAPYEIENEDGAKRIIIGDEDETIIGPAEYEITYVLDMGDDRISEYDELFYNLIGNGWDTGIDYTEFHVTFEKDADLSGAEIYAGAFESKDTQRAVWDVSENRIDGTVEALKAHESLTVFTRLPEGYFVGERKENVIPAVIASLLSIMLMCFTVFRFITKRGRQKVVETIEFYPPEGMSSAEVGYIIDGSADDKDILSLIFWLADKGYLTIEEIQKGKKNSKIIFHKMKDLPMDTPEHIRVFYKGLFGKSATATMKEAGKRLANRLPSAKAALASYFFGERKLEDKNVTTVSIVCGIAAGILLAFGVGGAEAFLGIGSSIRMAAILILEIIFFLLLILRQRNKAFVKQGVTRICAAIWIVFAFVYMIYELLYGLFPVYAVIVILANTITMFLASATLCPTAYKLEMSGRLLGLRTFIEKAELDRLERLVEENPSYFYRVLPFAYVFGLTDTWAKKFETLAVPEPEWWYGGYYDTYMPMYMVHSMTRCMDDAMGEVYKNMSTTQGTSSSGGGFSGGGFGGGGGGSW